MNSELEKILKERILILDGAMGTMIQRYNLSEEDYRGSQFTHLSGQMKGNNDMLNITRPEIIKAIHAEYLDAGADIIETNTFNSTRISMADYGMELYAWEINLAGAKNAREMADFYTHRNPNKPRFVAGSVGPTNKTASISPDVSNPAFRNVTFDELYDSFKEQISALIEGGVDMLLIETCFDTLNVKTALMAAEHEIKKQNKEIPIMLSFTIAGKSGRILSGQTLEAALASVSHVKLLSVGLNCSFGARDMKPFIKELGRIAPCYISAYPNAGLPNSLGQYDETPETMAEQIREYIEEELANIIGGCCGTTPAHIAQYERLIKNVKPHRPVEPNPHLILSGLNALEVIPQNNFLNIGERCNVAGSRKFLRLIKEKQYEEALQIARKQVGDGAQILDINVDDGLLDGVFEMTNFLNLIASEPDVASVPVMIDSSDWRIIEVGLKVLQGKSIVNSISLKNGEDDFLEKAKKVKSYGAAVIAMAFDEKGQADTFERKTEVCERMYYLLIDKAGFKPSDIIFDPNVLAIATGIEEHNSYAFDFIQTVEWIKNNLPGAKVSGGVSNLSFSFRGNNYLRESMHSVFLYHAIQKGMDMGIVNPSTAILYENIPSDLRNLLEDVILYRYPEAADKLIEYAQSNNEQLTQKEEKKDEWRSLPLEERLKYALIKGNDEYLESDLREALAVYSRPIDIIDHPLMEGMNEVGALFGEGKMFLPQVVKTARTMKKAVSILQPAIEKDKSDTIAKAGKILFATVKGDVHDIGKNITSVILSCNNYEIIDIGVMVPPEEIIAKAKEYQVDMVALSGLITPSLQEMAFVASEMEKAGFSIPIMIGGATTSKLHTALKIDPLYQGAVVHVSDASQAVPVASHLLNDKTKTRYTETLKAEYRQLREAGLEEHSLVSLEYARAHSFRPERYNPVKPAIKEKIRIEITVGELIPYINWAAFLAAWRLPVRFSHEQNPDELSEADKMKYEEAQRLLLDAKRILGAWSGDKRKNAKALIAFYPTRKIEEGISVNGKEIYFLRQQEKRKDDTYKSLADFFEPEDYVGMFVVSTGTGKDTPACNCGCSHPEDEYSVMMEQILRDRLVEAAAEYLHAGVRKEYWGYASDENYLPEELIKAPYQGIRPASGYPIHPDISLNFVIDEFLDMNEIGVTLTPNGALDPPASIAGLYIAHPSADYFRVGTPGEDQIEYFARRRGFSLPEMRRWLGL